MYDIEVIIPKTIISFFLQYLSKKYPEIMVEHKKTIVPIINISAFNSFPYSFNKYKEIIQDPKYRVIILKKLPRIFNDTFLFKLKNIRKYLISCIYVSIP